MALLLKRSINMSEVELVLVNDTDKCTITLFNSRKNPRLNMNVLFKIYRKCSIK